MPYNLGVSPTGPLPRGWHRVVWLDKGRLRYVISDDISAAALTEIMVRASTLTDGPDTVRFESWSDTNNAERV